MNIRTHQSYSKDVVHEEEEQQEHGGGQEHKSNSRLTRHHQHFRRCAGTGRLPMRTLQKTKSGFCCQLLPMLLLASHLAERDYGPDWHEGS
jgi:hypothetical protein